MGTKVAKVALGNIAARYGAMTLFANDTGAVTRSLLLYGEWAQREIEFLTGLFEPGATVLDVGAYIGTHTLAFAHRVGPSGLVLSFEAQPCSFELLERNVAANHLAQARLHHAAVSDAAGTVRFTPIDPSRKESLGSASLAAILRGDVAAAGNAEVTATTIDALELGRCDLIKIDVEDSEDLVLKGATRTLDRCRPLVYAECNSVDVGARICEILRSHGYELRLHLAPAFNPENFARDGQDIFGTACEAAILGVPPGRQSVGGETGPAEMLLPLETIDDLVRGLLNKPQYARDVLFKTAAAGFAEPILIGRLDDGKALLSDDALRNASSQLQAAHAALKQAHAKSDAAILQASLARRSANAALSALREHEFERERATTIAAGQAIELEHVRSALYCAEKGATERKAELEQARSALARAEARAAKHVAELEQMRDAFARAEELARERNSEIEQTRIALQRAEATAHAVLASTSWRLTAPIRRLARLLRRQ